MKSAILKDTRILLDKVSVALKPFIPQLQRTFTRCLTDENIQVRQCTLECISSLLSLQINVEPLIKEIEKGIRDDDTNVKETMLQGLHLILSKSGVSESSKKIVDRIILNDELWTSAHSGIRKAACLCVSSFLSSENDEHFLRYITF